MDTMGIEIDYSEFKVIRCDSKTDVNKYYSIIVNVKQEEERKRIREINRRLAELN